MRALLSKVMTSSMVVGAALLVAACGGKGEEATNNEAAMDLTNVETGNEPSVMESTNATDNMGMVTENVTTNATESSNSAATNGM
jgi:hypothetical protein